jgi:hypothetical protein
MEDDWDKLCLLIDMFPDKDFEFITSIFQEHDGDLGAVTNAIIGSQSPCNGFDHLVSTFPNLEVEAIEAFLIANEPLPQDFSELESLFMISLLNKPAKPKEKSLKMNLSDFIKVVNDDRSAGCSVSGKCSSYCTTDNFLFSCKFS